MKTLTKHLKDKLKAKLRDWCFSDYKWITRAQVQRILCSKMNEHRNNIHALEILMEVRKEIDPLMKKEPQPCIAPYAENT